MFKTEDNITICEYKANDKVYVGRATCHPEDKENYREYIGENLAADRAYIKYCKDEIKKLKIALKEVTHLINVLGARPQVEDKSLRVLKRRKWHIQREIEDYNITIDMLRSRISQTIYASNKYFNGPNSSNNQG